MSVLASAAIAAAGVASSNFQSSSSKQPTIIAGYIAPTKYVLPAIANAQRYVSPYSMAAYNPQCPAQNFSTSYSTPSGTRLY